MYLLIHEDGSLRKVDKVDSEIMDEWDKGIVEVIDMPNGKVMYDVIGSVIEWRPIDTE